MAQPLTPLFLAPCDCVMQTRSRSEIVAHKGSASTLQPAATARAPRSEPRVESSAHTSGYSLRSLLDDDGCMMQNT